MLRGNYTGRLDSIVLALRRLCRCGNGPTDVTGYRDGWLSLTVMV